MNEVEQEGETVVYGGSMKAPKVLADIVESVAAAVYVDCNFDLKTLWLVSLPVLVIFFFFCHLRDVSIFKLLNKKGS